MVIFKGKKMYTLKKSYLPSPLSFLNFVLCTNILFKTVIFFILTEPLIHHPELLLQNFLCTNYLLCTYK